MRFPPYGRLLLRWLRILSGRSYYHHPQPLGKMFRAGEIAGYFNDLTAKTQWHGDLDDEGIPVNVLADGRSVHFVTTIVQKALGHWDRWLQAGHDTEKQAFVKICRWLLSAQDDSGGWPVWSALGMSLPSSYSAMTQGECASAFVRAWKLTGEAAFAAGAREAIALLRTSVGDGGTAIVGPQELFLEELPSNPRSSILNGWVFALFGLYDVWLALDDDSARQSLVRTMDTLKRRLGDYDAGYWSYYDVRGHLTSPFYHDLHIHQLTALSMVDADPVHLRYRDRWIAYQQRRSNRVRASCVKALQKLLEPGEAVIVR